jgi:hypothetical protein
MAYIFSGHTTRPDAASAPGPTQSAAEHPAPDAPTPDDPTPSAPSGGAINFNAPVHQMRDTVTGSVHYHGEQR